MNNDLLPCASLCEGSDYCSSCGGSMTAGQMASFCPVRNKFNKPEPTVHESGATDRRGNLLSYTEKDLRAEVERMRRETIEECAKVCDWLANAVSNGNDVAVQNRQLCGKEIRGLLK